MVFLVNLKLNLCNTGYNPFLVSYNLNNNAFSFIQLFLGFIATATTKSYN